MSLSSLESAVLVQKQQGEGADLCNLQKERLCGKICQIWTWLSLPRPMILKWCYKAERDNTHTSHSPPHRTPSKVPTSWTQSKSQRAWSPKPWLLCAPGGWQEWREKRIHLKVKWRLFGLETKEGLFVNKERKKISDNNNHHMLTSYDNDDNLILMPKYCAYISSCNQNVF